MGHLSTCKSALLILLSVRGEGGVIGGDAELPAGVGSESQRAQNIAIGAALLLSTAGVAAAVAPGAIVARRVYSRRRSYARL